MNNYCIIGILGIFTGLSIFYQFKDKIHREKIQKWNKGGLLPYYSFFAPSPLTSDYRVIYRITNNGNPADFKEFVIHTSKTWYQGLFNSFKYYNKGLIDLCRMLPKEYQKLEKDLKNLIQISPNYIGILNAIIGTIKPQDRYDENKEIEFAIVKTQDTTADRDMSVVFRSFKHKLL